MMIVQQPVKINTIHISYLIGRITFQVHEKNHIEIESEQKEKITTIISEHAFYIKGIPQKETKQPSKGFFSTLFKHHEEIDEIPFVSLLVKVPQNSLHKIEVTGRLDIRIQGISSEIELHSFGKNTFKFERIPRLTLFSTGEIEGKVLSSQEFILYSSGKTKFDVKSEKMDKVSLSVNGVNNIQVKSLINVLNVDMIGNGRCLIKGKVHTKNISNSSLSDVILKE